jgi:hypothetical protein
MGGSAGARRTPARSILAALNVVALLAALWWADQIFSAGGVAGGERKAVRGAFARMQASRADKVVLLGSSTSRDWLPPRSLAAIFDVDTEDVLDAHINGCHQDCTWAQVRHLLAQGRHFDVAFYGTNLFQLCEYPHTKRALQQRELLPSGDRPKLLRLYAHSQHPLAHVGRFVGGAVSAVYADTTATQREAARRLLGRQDPDRSWVRAPSDEPREPPRCGYRDDEVAYKRAVSRALYADLGRLADRTFVLLLPDASLLSTEPDDVRAWEAHRALHRELADEYEHVTLIDLAIPRPREKYTDGVHLRPQAGVEQRRLLHQRLREGGYVR